MKKKDVKKMKAKYETLSLTDVSGIKEGNVLFVDFGEIDGTHLQKGLRPAIVLGHPQILGFSNAPTVQVVPVTASNKLKGIHIKLEDSVFNRISYAIPEQITTIDVRQIQNIKGSISLASMNKIKKAIYRQLGLKLLKETL